MELERKYWHDHGDLLNIGANVVLSDILQKPLLCILQELLDLIAMKSNFLEALISQLLHFS